MRTINNNAWTEKNNAGGGGGAKNLTRETYFTEISKNSVKIKKLYEQFSNLKLNGGKYIFYIRYSDLVPKTARPVFNLDLPKNLDHVCQRDIITDDNEYKVFYEITIEQYKNVLNIIENAMNGKLEYTLIKINYSLKYFLDKRCIGFFQSEPKLFVKNIEYVKLIYSKDDINELISKKILRKDNYIEETNSAYLNPSEYSYIVKNKPWLILKIISTSDFKIEMNGVLQTYDFDVKIKKFNKTVVGVIDSGINLPDSISIGINKFEDHRQYGDHRDIKHGSIVSSLIIAHDEINIDAKDGLGNFKVSHFEVLEPFEEGGDASASFEYMIKKIKQLVLENRSIKVWNLSFGSMKIPYTITISQIGIVLDKLSFDYDVIFIIASGNDRKDIRANSVMETLNMPADSYNSLAVGSVKLNDKGNVKPSDFSSIGKVLHFVKPDVSHWGDLTNQNGTDFYVYDGTGYSTGNVGTSFSAPKITRLIASFIDEGLNTKEAKAKLISFANKETSANKTSVFGYISDVENKSFELKSTRTFGGKKNHLIPINLLNEVERVMIVTCHNILPMKIFGEESSIYNFDVKLIVYNKKNEEPIYNNEAFTVENTLKIHEEMLGESWRRFEDGKYFNTKKSIFDSEQIKIAISELNNKKNIPIEDIAIGLRVKKLDLFETDETQKVSASLYIRFEGDFDHSKFEEINKNILEIDVHAEN